MAFLTTTQLGATTGAFDTREQVSSDARLWRSALDAIEVAYGTPAVFEATAKLKAVTGEIRARHLRSPKPVFEAARAGGELGLRAYDSIRGNVGPFRSILAESRATLASFEAAARAISPPVATASGAAVAAGPFQPHALRALQFTSEAEIDSTLASDLRSWRAAQTLVIAALTAREPLFGSDITTGERPRPLEVLRATLFSLRRRWAGAAVPSEVLTPRVQQKLDAARKRFVSGASAVEQAYIAMSLGQMQEALDRARAALDAPLPVFVAPKAPVFAPAPPAPVARPRAWGATPPALPEPSSRPRVESHLRAWWPYYVSGALASLAFAFLLWPRKAAA